MRLDKYLCLVHIFGIELAQNTAVVYFCLSSDHAKGKEKTVKTSDNGYRSGVVKVR